MNTFYLYNYPNVTGSNLVPFMYPQISADNWFDAMKKIYLFKKDMDITNIIISDQLRNARRANIMYGMRNGHRIANINMFPYMLPSNISLGTTTTNPNMTYPLNTTGPMSYSQSNDGIYRNGTLNFGTNTVGPVPVMRQFYPTHNPGFWFNNKNGT